MFAHEGAIGKAAGALDSHGVHDMNEAVQEALLSKHPQEPRISDPALPPPPSDTTPEQRNRVEAITQAEIMQCITRFPHASAAGASGLSPTHLRELLHVPEAADENGLCAALAALVTQLARGNVPDAVAPWLAGAPLTPLRKRDNGVRPIAVGETIRRITSSILMNRVRDTAHSYLGPHQVGVATRAGCEAILHATHDLVDTHGDDDSFALLQIDLRNAFNEVSRQAFLHEVAGSFPQLLPWCTLCYGAGQHAHLWTRTFQLQSVHGVQQGDPLGPLLFALALKPLIDHLRASMPKWQAEADARAPTADTQKQHCMLSFYMDDGVLIARHHVLLRAFEYINSAAAHKRGLFLGTKCEVWWPAAPHSDTRDMYDRSITQRLGEPGTMLLRAPIGSIEYMQAQVCASVHAKARTIDALKELPDAHAAFTILRSCFGTCQMNYLLRAVPSTATLRGAGEFDELVASAVRALAAGPITNDVMSELRLPVRVHNSKRPHFGAGLTSAVTVAPAAYLASIGATHATSRSLMLAGAIRTPSTQTYVQIAYARFTDHTEADAPVPALDEFCCEAGSAGTPPTQRDLCALAHSHAQTLVPLGCARTQAYRALQALPGAKDWLLCRPCPAQHTHIGDRHFRTWLAFYCRAPLRNQADTHCRRPLCSAAQDPLGDHALTCTRSASANYSPIIRRHDQLVRVLATELRRAVRSPAVEPRDMSSRNNTRPDITAINARGGIDALDVSVCHVFGDSSRLARTHKSPASYLAGAAAAKVKHHAQYAREQGADVVPILMAATGGWLHDSHAYVTNIAHDIAHIHSANPSRVRAIIMQRCAARLIMSSAQCILADAHEPLT